jgi:hypothetical protein
VAEPMAVDRHLRLQASIDAPKQSQISQTANKLTKSKRAWLPPMLVFGMLNSKLRPFCQRKFAFQYDLQVDCGAHFDTPRQP